VVDVDPILIASFAGAGVIGLLIGVALGRRGSSVARARELRSEVEALLGQNQGLQNAKQQLEGELQQARGQADEYKKKVVDHFYGTSEELRSLTLQYRAVYDHLAEGARQLCPDSFTALEGALDAPALGAEAGDDLEVDSEAERSGS
jgi:uncharacterized membrane-anchored protein YhcB (DUF1043 family)